MSTNYAIQHEQTSTDQYKGRGWTQVNFDVGLMFKVCEWADNNLHEDDYVMQPNWIKFKDPKMASFFVLDCL